MHDTIIIGGGIAGMTAALYASRNNIDFRIFSAEPGGQFMVSGEVLNYPGFTKTTGVEFYMKMEEQMKFNNVTIENRKVDRIERVGENFKVIADDGEHETRTVIIATGARARKLGVPGEEKFNKKGLAYCSVCDGPLFKGKEVVIIGGGNAALEAVDFMKHVATRIHMLVKDKDLRGHDYLIENVKKIENAEIHYGAETIEVYGETKVEGIRYRQDGEEKGLKVDGVIIEIGRTPNTEFVKDLVELDKEGHIVVDCQGHTNVPGVLAAGDCASGHEYQYVIAAGQGCMALMKVIRYLANKRAD
ncbi:TPA: FAD-dependent oxidoreductase [Candidatus Woesearchaeota archaeon]|nr:FAD-dependent oxidoreductase [Candidatus Woesearchaeota archaeon]